MLRLCGVGQNGAVDKIYKGYFIWYNRKKYERVARMQLKIHMVTIEDLMPQDHFLRKLEKALDLSFVYEETRHLYSQKYGRYTESPLNGRLRNESKRISRFAGTWVWICWTGFRITVPFRNCAEESRNFGTFSGAYSMLSFNSA